MTLQQEILSLKHTISEMESYIKFFKKHTIEIKKAHALRKAYNIASRINEEQELLENEENILKYTKFLDELKKDLSDLKIKNTTQNETKNFRQISNIK